MTSPFAKLVADLVREDQGRQWLENHNAMIQRTQRGGARMQKSFAEIDAAMGVLVKSYAADVKRKQAEDKAEFRRRFSDLNRLGNLAASLGHLSSTEAAKMDARLADIGHRARAAGL